MIERKRSRVWLFIGVRERAMRCLVAGIGERAEFRVRGGGREGGYS